MNSTKVSRRDFGKWLSLACASLALPIAVAAAKTKERQIVTISVSTNISWMPISKRENSLTTVTITYDDKIVETYQTFSKKSWQRHNLLCKGQFIGNDTYVYLNQNYEDIGNNLSLQNLILHHKDYVLVVPGLKLSSITYPTGYYQPTSGQEVYIPVKKVPSA